MDKRTKLYEFVILLGGIIGYGLHITTAVAIPKLLTAFPELSMSFSNYSWLLSSFVGAVLAAFWVKVGFRAKECIDKGNESFAGLLLCVVTMREKEDTEKK